MELWGDPAVTALIDSRGKLTEAQVYEKLNAEIERERSSGVQYWALFDHRNGDFVGCGGLRPWVYTPSEADFEVGFHLVKRCWGKGFGTTFPKAPPGMGALAGRGIAPPPRARPLAPETMLFATIRRSSRRSATEFRCGDASTR